jgi:hypothetical protein
VLVSSQEFVKQVLACNQLIIQITYWTTEDSDLPAMLSSSNRLTDMQNNSCNTWARIPGRGVIFQDRIFTAALETSNSG